MDVVAKAKLIGIPLFNWPHTSPNGPFTDDDEIARAAHNAKNGIKKFGKL